MNVAVTTTRRPFPQDRRRALVYAKALHVPYLERDGRSFASLLQLLRAETPGTWVGFLVIEKDDLSIWTPEGTLRYHPGMALHRVAGLRRGQPDTMVEAMQLGRGDSVLDCTAGLASDSVVASHAVGEVGKVVALETVGALALLLKVGLKRYPGQGETLTQAMRRVRVCHSSYVQFLRCCSPNSFDVVYFDPMFSHPVVQSSGIAPLRPLADYSPVSEETLKTAYCVARRAVVLKDRSDGPYATQMPWDDIKGGSHSRVTYLVRYSKGRGKQ